MGLNILGREIWENEAQFDQIRMIAQELEFLRRQFEQRSGVWTPGYTFGGSAAGITYGTQSGFWFKQGSLVVAVGSAIMTNNGSGTGQAVITGLPFTVKDLVTGAVDGAGQFVSASNIGAALDDLHLYPISGTKTANIDRRAAAALTSTIATEADLTNTFDGRFVLIYLTDEE